MIGLPWECIDFGRNLITVNHIYDKVIKEIRNTTKGKKMRYIGINELLKKELLLLRKIHPKAKFVFESENETNWDQDNFRHRYFSKDVIETEVEKIRIHDLRHTFASHYVMNGGNIYDLQKILGHSDTKTTMRYAHLAPSHIAHTASLVKYSYENEPKNVINFFSKPNVEKAQLQS